MRKARFEPLDRMRLRGEVVLLLDPLALSLERRQFAHEALALQRRVAVGHGAIDGHRAHELVVDGARRAQFLTDAQDRRVLLRKGIRVRSAVGPVLRVDASVQGLGIVGGARQRYVVGLGIDATQLQCPLDDLLVEGTRIGLLQVGVKAHENLPGDHRFALAHRDFRNAPSVEGLDETRVCIGDEWRIGSVRLRLTQGRQPCFRLNLRFGVREMAAQVQDSLRTGWYCRVLEPGELAAGDVPELLRRPHPDWSVARLLALIRDRVVDARQLAAVLELPLTPSWRKLFTQRLQLREAEDWTRRLDGA